MRILFLLLSFAIFKSTAQERNKIYHVKKITTQIKVDGKPEDPGWMDIAWSDNFVDIEGVRKGELELVTKYKMCWNDQGIYWLVWMEEPHVWATIEENEKVIFHDNDIEFFVDPNGDNHLYMEYELNALESHWDLLLVKPYQNGGPALTSWDFAGTKKAVYIKGSLNDNSDLDTGWYAEVFMPFSSIMATYTRLPKPKPGDFWRVNFSRVQWEHQIKGTGYERKKDKNGRLLPEYNWVWSAIGQVDMHQPDRWGYAVFEDKNPIDFKIGTPEQIKKELMRCYRLLIGYKNTVGHWPNQLEQMEGYSESRNKLYVYEFEKTKTSFVLTVSTEKSSWAINQNRKLYTPYE